MTWCFVRVCAAALLSCGGLTACAQGPATMAQGPDSPGWTGRTIVPGNNSTIAGDAEATYQQQKWPYGNRP
ncbi:MAG TPA: hypothetical protein VE690_17865 [Rhodopila sp.]|nr:hypothetical protein [Rhodopila sp.]